MAVETATSVQPARSVTKRAPLLERVLSIAGNILTPPLDWNKLPFVDLIVVHGGGGRRAVEKAISLQEEIAAKRGSTGKDDEVDLRPPLFFTGRWSINTPKNQRPRLRDGTVVPESIYMEEVALGLGVPRNKIAGTEMDSETTRGNVKQTLGCLEERDIPHQTILFISAHIYPRRTLMLWEHFGNGTVFLPVGASTIQPDDQINTLSEAEFRKIRLKDGVRELAKVVATAALLKFRIW